MRKRRVHSSRSRDRWESWEDDVLSFAPRSVVEIATFLGRTEYAVTKRAERLQKKRRRDVMAEITRDCGRCFSCVKRGTDDCKHKKISLMNNGGCPSWSRKQ